MSAPSPYAGVSLTSRLESLRTQLTAAACASSTSPSAADRARLAAWDDCHPLITAIYQFNLSPAGRSELARIEYDRYWRGILTDSIGMVPLIIEDWQRVAGRPQAATAAAKTTADASSRVEVTAESDEEDDDSDDEVELHVATRARLGSISRILILLKNLCPTPSFQSQLRRQIIADTFGLDGIVEFIPLLSLPPPLASIDPAPLMKTVLQLYANMITPGGSTTDDDGTDALSVWQWVHDSLAPKVLRPILLQPSLSADLHSIATCIVHHALLCQNADTTCAIDLSAPTRTAVQSMLNDPALLVHPILRASAPSIAAQLKSVYEDEVDSDQKRLLTLWEWHPHQREPAWIVHIIHLCLRSAPDFLSRLHTICSDVEWNLVLRCAEVWSESLQSGEDASQEVQRMQIAAGHTTRRNERSSELTHSAESISANAVFLLQWLQRREHVPLPPVVVATPVPTDPTSTSFASMPIVPPAATSSIPLDAATNSVLHTVGNILLFGGWDGTIVFTTIRAAFAELDMPELILGLLSAADTLDGGSMFSTLYRPAGHTRHTKTSTDPTDYVNQFSEKKDADESKGSDSAAATGASGTASSSAAPPSIRSTPYMLKSNLLRLLASLVFHSRSAQSAFGPRAVYACMNHSVLDDHNPLMREYAVLALRNLLEDHEENQRAVAELRNDGVANQAEMQELGVQARMDEETGKVRIATTKKE